MANRQILTPEWLVTNAKLAHTGVDVKTTPREILTHFDKERRHPDTILSIRKALRKLQVKTSPRFYSVNLDSQISILPSDKRPTEEEPKEDSRQPIITFGMLKCVEQQRELRIPAPTLPNGEPARQPYPKWILGPQEPIESAVVLLAQKNVDYVPVGIDETKIMGVICWDDIAMQGFLNRDKKVIKCGSCCSDPIFVQDCDSVYDKKQEMTESGYVIVRDEPGRCFAVVSASDLAVELLRLTESFLLLQEIENLIRQIIAFTDPSIEELIAPAWEKRKQRIKSIDDLQFEEYKGVLLHPPIFERLTKELMISGILVEQIANEHIETVRNIRNKVLHFHPDENSDLVQKTLSNTRDMLIKLVTSLEANS